MALATRNAAETLAREQARWLADQGKTLAALEELAEALGLPGPPVRIECYDISNFQGSESVGSMVVFEEGRPRSGRVPAVPDQDGRGAERLREPPGGPPPPVPGEPDRPRRGARRSGAGRCPTSSSSTAARARSSAAKDVLDELGLHDLPLVGPGQGARGAVPARSRRPDRAAGDVAGAVPRPAPPRRGAPVRDHLPPRPAGEADRPLGVRRPARRRAEAQARAAQGVRLGQARPRGAGRADRRRPGHRPRRWPSGSRRPSRPEGRRRSASGGRSVYHPPTMRRAGPILIVLIGVLALIIDFFPNLTAPGQHGPDGEPPDRDEAGARPAGRPAGRVPGAAGRRQDADRRRTWRSSRTSSSAG